MDTVFADDEDRVLELLGEAESLDLLGTTTIGRVAFTAGALPAIQPVSFRLAGREVVIPTRPGSTVALASRGAVLAFETDDVRAADRTGWAVTVVGPSRLVRDPAEVAALDRAGPRSWVTPGDRCYVAITARLVSGRRVGRRPGAGLPVPAGPDGAPAAQGVGARASTAAAGPCPEGSRAG